MEKTRRLVCKKPFHIPKEFCPTGLLHILLSSFHRDSVQAQITPFVQALSKISGPPLLRHVDPSYIGDSVPFAGSTFSFPV